MSFITSPNTLVKGEQGSIDFDKDAFLFQVTISDPYFANERNWKRLVLVFEDAAGKQKQYAIVTDDWSRANFEPSETSRTGVWGLQEIHIYDHHQGLYVVPRADLPSPENFDVEATRIVAPSSTVASIESVENINSNPDFAVLTVEDAGWTKTVDNGSDAVIDDEGNPAGPLVQEPIPGAGSGTDTDYEYGPTYAWIRRPGFNRVDIAWDGQSFTNAHNDSEATSFTYAGWTYTRGVLRWNNGTSQYNYEVKREQVTPADAVVKLQTDSGALGTIKLEKTFPLEAGQRYVVKYDVTDKDVVGGIVNDLGVYVRNVSNAVIDSNIHSAAPALVQSITFIAEGDTKVSFESSGQGGFWKIDNVEMRKNPDEVTVPLAEVEYYKVGYKVKLWDVGANDFLTADIYEIAAIDVDVVTLDQPIAGDYDGKTLLLKFPNYDDSSAEQKGLFQYVGKGY